MTQGYLCLVFHGHLPYVRHPEHDYFLEENWFFEALTDTYLPLLGVWDGLVRDGIHFRVTVSLSPTLINMMADSLLVSRYQRHLDRLIELAEKEVERTRHQPEFCRVAQMYRERFGQIRDRYRGYQGDLIGAFRRLEEQGVIELVTSAATHGFLPLLSTQPTAVGTQVRVGIETFKHFVGHSPKGLWLPECGYYPGADEILKKAGLRYCFLESHGLLYAQPRPKYGVYAPIYTDWGLAAFGRDPESSKQVWSAEEGYPGDPDYREYYRDIGFDLDYHYVRPYIHPDGIRINTGIKYHRITGKTNDKQVYVRSWALAKTDQHAGNFLFNRQKQIEWLAPQMGRPPIVVAPYDLELFGHWWFEGPEWLDLLIRKLVCDQQSVKMITPSEYLEHYPINQVTTPSASSWGYKGYNEVWLNGKNDWAWRHIHHAAQRMAQLVRDHPSAHGVKQRALNQALRELLLAQSSDWPFMMKTGQQVEYAIKRIKDHLLNFLRLADEINSGQIDEPWLKDLEDRDNPFPFLDYRSFHP